MKKILSFILLIAISTTFYFNEYEKVFTNPNDYIFCNSGDGIKNYYAYAYHVKHDSTYFHFEGMNYPYGELTTFTDGQPAIANTVKFLTNFFPSLSSNSIGVINFLMIFSLIISAIFIYLILLKFKVNHWFAAFAAFSISLLSPQIFRTGGHITMAYSFFIPMTWYIFLLFTEKKNKFLVSSILLITSSVFFFIHPYLGFISILFIFAYWFVYFLYNKKELKVKSNYIYILMQVFLPILVFQLIIIFNDTHIERTSAPWGFFSYTATPKTVFIPITQPFNPYVHKICSLFNITFTQKWEGWAYIGLVGDIAILFTIITLIKRFIRRKKKAFVNIIPDKKMQYFLLAGTLLLLFSMAIPFRYAKWSLDFLPGLEQFRALGRFAWVFFYVATIYSVYLIDVYYKKSKKKIFPISLMILAVVLFYFEGKPYHTGTANSITKTKNLFLKENLDKPIQKALDKISPHDYQAIIPLPFYMIGSDVFGIDGTTKTHQLSQLFSYHTGLSLFGGSLSRTSAIEAKNATQLVSTDFYNKAIKKDLKSGKKILILYTKESLSFSEKQILDKSKIIYQNKKFSIGEISIEKLFKTNSLTEIEKFNSQKERMFFKDNFYTTDSNTVFVYEDFEKLKSNITYRGKGTYNGLQKDWNILKKIPANLLLLDKEYSFSFWFNNKNSRSNTHTILEEKDTTSGKNNWIHFQHLTKCREINGDWSMVELKFKPKKNHSYTILIKPKKKSKEKIYVDDLLVKPVDVDIYSIDEEKRELYKNNHLIKY